MYKKILTVIVLIISIVSCKENKNIEIDNPGNVVLKIKIDEKELELQPLSTIKFKILSGKHSLTIDNNEILFDLPKEGEYLLNPSKSTYIIEEVLFGRDNWKFSINNTNEKINSARKTFNRTYEKLEDKLFMISTIELGGFKLDGFYKKESTLLIRKIWDYNINENVPNSIKIKGYGNKTDNPLMGELHLLRKKGKVKIYRIEDFMNKIK